MVGGSAPALQLPAVAAHKQDTLSPQLEGAGAVPTGVPWGHFLGEISPYQAGPQREEAGLQYVCFLALPL